LTEIIVIVIGPKKHRNRGPSFKIGRVSLNAKTLLSTLEELEPLDLVLPPDASSRRKWVLDFRVKPANFDCDWEIEDDSNLLRGIYDHGMGSWEAIKMDTGLKLAEKILLAEEKKPQAKHLQSRAEYLLKILKKIGDQRKGVVSVFFISAVPKYFQFWADCISIHLSLF